VFENAMFAEGVADFYLMKPNGKQFGQKIQIKFKICEKIDDAEFYQRAMNIFDEIKDPEDGLFEMVIDALKEAGNDVQMAKIILQKKRSPEEEEDLYS